MRRGPKFWLASYYVKRRLRSVDDPNADVAAPFVTRALAEQSWAEILLYGGSVIDAEKRADDAR